MIRILSLIGGLLLFAVPPLCATEAAILITEEIQLRVADSFMEEKEYYRAITEYKRFLFLFPDSARGDYALLQTAIAYLNGGESEGAVRSLDALRERYPLSPHMDASAFYTGMAYRKARRAQESCRAFLHVAREYPDSSYSPRALAAASLVELENDNHQASQDLLDRFVREYPDHRHIENVRRAMAVIDQHGESPGKSEVLAGILSAVIPGAGYAYAGEYGTAFMSFLVNGAFIAGAWTALAQELYGVGALVGGVGTPFYIGNIYGSILAAKKWNRAVRQEMRERVYSLLNFAFAESP